MTAILINGIHSDQVSILDRGFQYGDGVFETMRVAQGEPLHWALHLKRLAEGCRRLHIDLPDENLLREEAVQLCRDVTDAVLKLTITRGTGGRGYAINNTAKATRVLAVFPSPVYPQENWTDGVAVKICETRLSRNPALAGIKHLNRLEQVLARAEWDDPDIAEGLMLDELGNVIEGTMSNLFCVIDNVLHTPDLAQCGVQGISRTRVLETAEKLGYANRVAALKLDEIKQASEVFLTNSLINLWPVRQLGTQSYSVGPMSHEILTALRSDDE